MPLDSSHTIHAHNDTMPGENRGEMGATEEENGSNTGETLNDSQMLEPQSPKWRGFARYTQNTLNRIGLDIVAMRKQLGWPDANQIVPMLNTYSVKTHRWTTNVSRAEEDLREFAFSGNAPQEEMDKIQKDISDLNDDLDILNSLIETLKKSAREESDPQKDLVAAIKKINTSNRDIANSPMISLPTFQGQTTRYAGFKENFQVCHL